jgi:hypothetical protein
MSSGQANHLDGGFHHLYVWVWPGAARVVGQRYDVASLSSAWHFMRETDIGCKNCSTEGLISHQTFEQVYDKYVQRVIERKREKEREDGGPRSYLKAAMTVPKDEK